jgi:hypothetical protein
MYKENLTSFIVKKIVHEDRMVTMIDCMNYINQYMFRRTDIDIVSENLFITRIEQIYDLLDLLKRIQFNSYFAKSKVLLLTSFQHLLKDLDKDEQEFFNTKISQILMRLEKNHKKEIVLMEVKKNWDIPFLQKEL